MLTGQAARMTENQWGGGGGCDLFWLQSNLLVCEEAAYHVKV
jgi:hypothetical protein